MRADALVAKLAGGDVVHMGWATLGSPLVCEMLGRSDFGAVTIDMQHGAISFEQAHDMTGALVRAECPPVVRIPVGDFATVSRALDFGAQAIIAPMINSVGEAQKLVHAVKYAPVGERSYGPIRACELYGVASSNDYIAQGNENCLALAMIETEQAVSRIEEILAVEGLDGIFLGPADLSLTLLAKRGETRVDLDDEEANGLYRLVAQKAREAGKIASVYAATPELAHRFAGYGYQLIAVGSDRACMKAGLTDVFTQLTR